MGGCQNYGPFLGALNIRCRIKIGIQKRDYIFDNHPHVPQSSLTQRVDCREASFADNGKQVDSQAEPPGRHLPGAVSGQADAQANVEAQANADKPTLKSGACARSCAHGARCRCVQESGSVKLGVDYSSRPLHCVRAVFGFRI